MGKIKVLAVLEVEEGLFTDKSEHLKAEDVDINIGQDMLVSFSGLQIDLYHRDVRMNGNKIALTLSDKSAVYQQCIGDFRTEDQDNPAE